MKETSQKIKSELAALKDQINYHNNLYYNFDSPEISDEEYDKLYTRLKTLERENPSLITPDSPTQKIGGSANVKFAPVEHLTPMLSLDNTYSAEEILEWHSRAYKGLGKTFDMVVEAKIDGVSCSLTYEHGVLKKAATRGDGKTGEDITANILTVKNIPHKIHFTDKIEIRGEVYIDKSDLLLLNEKQTAAGGKIFANARNAAAGSIRQKDSAVTAARPLKFFAHSFGYGDIKAESFSAFIDMCKSFGFSVSPERILTSDINEVIEFYNDFEKRRSALAYDVDGLVVKVNSFKDQNTLGWTAKSPRWAVAFKYAAQTAKTVVNKIIFSVGRTGVITPVAELEPVPNGGVIISHATLHNFDEIDRLGVSEGDEVLIERAGEVIPKVLQVLTKGHGAKVLPPSNCPSCGAPVYKDDDGVAYRCINPSCPAQIRGRIIHFASRGAMDIDGFGESVTDQLLEKKLIKDYADIYDLAKEQILTLELFKDKKADNLINAINKSKERPLSRLIYAFGIRHVGEKTGETIAVYFKNMDALLNASAEEIEKIDEVGPIVGKSVYDFMQSVKAREEIERLRAHGLNFIQPQGSALTTFTGKTFVFTGTLEKMSRPEAESLVKQHGGKASSSVSAKTTYVVAGAEAGSKLEKAKKLAVNVISEDEFLEMIK
ncbi:DNA ligase (NAD+) [Parelusimicrobium proximum]|uniref:NAD-dependent DNA ligase LigA n=1 Tax=Parelusimicrobium proximum TaxID=3228953 RepID=UPI003D17543B